MNRLALAAIALWLLTLAAFGWFFVHGRTVPGTDDRTAIVLAPTERDLVLSEMRGLLTAVHAVLEGVGRGDRQQIARAARAAGMGAAADVDPALMAKLPLPFKQLGMSVHRDMDALAAAADQGRPSPELQDMLTGTLAKCIACHAAWQFANR